MSHVALVRFEPRFYDVLNAIEDPWRPVAYTRPHPFRHAVAPNRGNYRGGRFHPDRIPKGLPVVRII